MSCDGEEQCSRGSALLQDIEPRSCGSGEAHTSNLRRRSVKEETINITKKNMDKLVNSGGLPPKEIVADTHCMHPIFLDN